MPQATGRLGHAVRMEPGAHLDRAMDDGRASRQDRHPVSGRPHRSPVDPGSGWPGDPANAATPVAHCAADVARLLHCRYVQTTPVDDIYGIEYSAVMKNIIALASGITRGLGYGDNFQAVLVSNAMQEIKRFVDAIYPKHRDLSGSAYLGDLLVTAYSPFSRNRTFGTLIGRGYTIQSAQAEMNMIAEGYYAVKSIHEINRQFGVDMPIVNAVYNILYNRAAPTGEMNGLKDKLN